MQTLDELIVELRTIVGCDIKITLTVYRLKIFAQTQRSNIKWEDIIHSPFSKRYCYIRPYIKILSTLACVAVDVEINAEVWKKSQRKFKSHQRMKSIFSYSLSLYSAVIDSCCWVWWFSKNGFGNCNQINRSHIDVQLYI